MRVHVRVTEYDRATSNYLEPLHARKVARAVERQLNLIAALSLLKTTSDLAPRALPQTVDQLKVSWVGVSWRRVMVVRSGSVELGGTALHGSFTQPNVRWNISVNTSHIVVVTCTKLNSLLLQTR